MINSLIKFIQGIVNIRGSTDNTLIGNVSDSLKTNITNVPTVKNQDGSGNNLTSQASGAQRALDVGINVSGTQIDPRQIRTLTSSDIVTSQQGTTPWLVGGTAPAGSSPTYNPVSVAGIDGNGLKRHLLTDTSGKQIVNLNDGSGNAITSSSYNGQRGVHVNIADGSQLDNLQRLRVSESVTLLGIPFDSSPQTLLVNQSTSGSATITNNLSISTMALSTTTASGDSAILQTKEYLRYTPGRSYIGMVSGNIGAKKSNVRQRIGIFDSSDGLFFEQTGTDLAVVIRSSTSGSVVDTRILQSNWNIDKLDGTGLSGFTLDTSKHNVYIIDYLWLGAGRVRWGVDIGGKVIYCHEYDGGNVNATAYMRSASLPLRAEITNTAGTASSTTMNIACFSAQRESFDNPYPTVIFSQSRGTTTLATNATAKPLISIRPKLTFNGITNRTPVIPKSIQILSGAQNTLIQVFLNPTLTSASWTSADTLSSVEYDVSATALTGGTAITEFYVASGSSMLITSSDLDAISSIILGLNIAGTSQDILTITATSLAGGTNTFGSISWKEYQ
jgi:hypothetical protein